MLSSTQRSTSKEGTFHLSCPCLSIFGGYIWSCNSALVYYIQPTFCTSLVRASQSFAFPIAMQFMTADFWWPICTQRLQNDVIEPKEFTLEKFQELYQRVCPRNDIEELFNSMWVWNFDETRNLAGIVKFASSKKWALKNLPSSNCSIGQVKIITQ